MKCVNLKKITRAVIFLVGIVLSWGGMIYACNHGNDFRLSGVWIALIGYCVVCFVVCTYETAAEK